MSLVKNIINLLFYFLIFLVIIFVFYIFLFLRPIDYLTSGDRNLLINDFLPLVTSYFYPAILIASTMTVLFFGAMNSSKSKVISIIAIFLFSVLMLAYPAYIISTEDAFKDSLVIDSNVLTQTNLPFYIEPNKINDYAGYSIYAGDKITKNTYSGVIVSDNKDEYNMYLSQTGVIDNDVIILSDFDSVNYSGDTSKDQNSIELVMSDDKNMKNIVTEYIFSLKSLSILNSLLYLFSFSSLGFMGLGLILILLFLFLVSCYFLSMSLSSPVHLYHNLLTTIILYIFIKIGISLCIKLFNINAQLIVDSNIIIVSFIIILVIFLINILALIINRIFRFSEFYHR